MVYVRTEPQVRIAVYDKNPGARKTVLMVHGWPLSHRMFEYQVNMLAEQGFRTVTIDIRGFGNSDCPAKGYSYNTLARDINIVVRELNLQRFTLVGFSMGGAIVIRYMSLFQGFRVEKLALLGAAAPVFTKRPDYPYGLDPAAVDALIEGARTDRPKMVHDFGGMLFASNPSPQLREFFFDIGLSATGIGTIETAKSLRDEDMRPDLGKIRVPTGIFHGRLDQICPYKFAELMHEGIAGSVLYPFDKSGHAVFYDELELFNQEFLEFLKNG